MASDARWDRDRIGALYDTYGAQIFRRCRRILGDDEAAMDAMQDVFVKALKAGDSFRGEASPLTWLYTVSTHLCLNRLRDQKGRYEKIKSARLGMSSEGLGDPAHLSGGRLPGAAAMERQALLRPLLMNLDEERRRIVLYFYFDGMTHEEIAKMMGLSRPTIRKRLASFHEEARLHFGVEVAPDILALALILAGLTPAPWEVIL